MWPTQRSLHYIFRSHHRLLTFTQVQESEYTMSEHDDTLLDEDLGDDEYDLGNDEEEALLADDYELERVSILLDHYFVVKWKLVHHYVSSYNIQV